MILHEHTTPFIYLITVYLYNESREEKLGRDYWTSDAYEILVNSFI